MRYIITATESDGFITQTVPIEIIADYQNTSHLIKAIKSACCEYILTPEGRKVYKQNHKHFNWGDFLLNVPNEICKKHFFQKVEENAIKIEVDYNQQLIEEN